MPDRYVTASGGATSGDATTPGTAWTLAHAAAGAPDTTDRLIAGDVVHVMPGTYALTSDLVLSKAGTQAAPIIWQGYNSTIGDLNEVVNSGARPLFDMTAARLNIPVAYNKFRNIDIVGDYSNSIVTSTAAGTKLWNCKIHNDGVGLSCSGISLAGNNPGFEMVGCLVKVDANGDDGNRCMYTSSSGVIVGCVFDGAKHGFRSDSGGANRGMELLHCLFVNQVGTPIDINTPDRPKLVANCTIMASTGNAAGIDVSAPQAEGWVTLLNNLIVSPTTYGILTAGNAYAVIDIGNAIYNPGTAARSGGSATRIYGAVTESSNPIVNAAGGDYGLVTGANSKAGAFPGVLEGFASTHSYLDIGAVQRQEAGGTIASILHAAGLRGGFQ